MSLAHLAYVATATNTGAGRSPAGRVLAVLRTPNLTRGLTVDQIAATAGLPTPLALDQLRRLSALHVVRQAPEGGTWQALPAGQAVK